MTTTILAIATSLPRCLRKAAASWRAQSGSSLLEVALMMPMFSIIILGAAEFTRLAYAEIEVTSAARSGAEYGAQTTATATDLTGVQNFAVASSPDVTTLQATASTFCTCSNGTTITCASAGTSCTARIAEYIQVNTSASIDPLFHVPGLPTTYTLSGVAVQRVAQ
ncbi:MAG: TadE/TadG family type IV pilus assembly protein [Acidobacteriota bacterium]